MPENKLKELKDTIELVRQRMRQVIEENAALRIKLAEMSHSASYPSETLEEFRERQWKEYEEWKAKRGL